jgi:hypothetical protein
MLPSSLPNIARADAANTGTSGKHLHLCNSESPFSNEKHSGVGEPFQFPKTKQFGTDLGEPPTAPIKISRPK